MTIIYKSNEQILIEIKKLMLEAKTTQREIANTLNIKPQALTKIMNKKNFSFEDAKKILSAMGYDLVVDFRKNQTQQTTSTPPPTKQAEPQPTEQPDEEHIILPWEE